MTDDQAGAPPQRHRARLDRWERLEGPAIAALPYIMLVLASAIAVPLDPRLPAVGVSLGVAALTGAWMLWGFTLHPAWRERPRRMAVFFAVLAILMAVLVIRSPIYGFFTFTAYFYTYWLGYWPWRFAGVTAVAVLSATSQDGGLPGRTAGGLALYGVFIVLNVGVAGGMVWFTYVSSVQNDRRKQAVADLSEANRKLEATLAENAGLHEQLVAQAREAGVYDERQRMAREIHDTLAQSLAGIITQLQAADQAVAPPERRRHRESALALAREGLSEARRSVAALRPEPLQQAGRIEDALAVVAGRWSELHGVQAAVTTTGPSRPIPAQAELVLLRTAQEALANVARHARARTVRLTLSYIGDQVTLDVRDDGTGFAAASDVSRADGPPAAAFRAPAAAPDGHLRGGFGLTAMRERVEGMAGTLAVESEPGAGTTISARLPAPCPGVAR